MKYIQILSFTLVLIFCSAYSSADENNADVPSERELVETALDFLGSYFRLSSEYVHEVEGITAIENPKSEFKLRVDLAHKALHAFTVRRIFVKLYEKKFMGVCHEDSSFNDLLSELTIASKPLSVLGAYYYKNGIEEKVIEEMTMWSGRTSKALVNNAVSHSMSISLEHTDCSGFYKNLKEWTSLYKSMDATN